MSGEEIDLLVSRLRPESYPARATIIRQGDEGDSFYIVQRGHVEVTQRDARGVTEVVNQLDRGGYFGELALLHDAPRNATCRATVPTQTLVLSRQDFDDLVKSRFTLREKVDHTLERAAMLRRLPLFAELDGLQIQRMAAQMELEELEGGTVFIEQDRIGDKFYVVESGKLEVFVSQDGEERTVTQRGPGEYVGEIALLLEVPRTASVRTLEPTRLLVLRKEAFDQLVSKHLYVSRGLELESSRRMMRLRRVAVEGD
jgi:cAMP-dependent protein kinase regulator